MRRSHPVYERRLKTYARENRANMPIGEALLWTHIRHRQVNGIRFLRQRPVGSYILDFFAPAIQLAIEIDGATHDWKGDYDRRRDKILERQGIEVLHFTEGEVRRDVCAVVKWIEKITKQIK